MNGRRRARHLVVIAGCGLVAWLGLAYLVLPWAWAHHEHQPQLAALSMVTRTAQGIPGDPLNVGLVGSRADVVVAMNAAGWFPADPVTLRTSIEIAGSVVLDRPYRDAPVSPLYVEGRVQDLAFEKPSGTSADRRHHVRVWLALDKGQEGRPVWLGAVTFDRSVGFSHYTGAITHHIAPDIDAERDDLIGGLVTAGLVAALYQITGIGPTLNGRNGGGDYYFTDGEIHFARLVSDGKRTTAKPLVLDAPTAVRLKDQILAAAKGVLPKR